MFQKLIRASSVCLAVLCASVGTASADKREKTIALVNDSADTVAYFAADTAFEALHDLADDAKAMVIIPKSIRAGFIIGGSAGDAVLVARKEDGTWSQPTFLTIGSLSFGFQAGGEASESVLLVMTQRGLENLLSTSVKLGADISVAAGPVGAGAKAQTTDILAFSRSRGLYGGVSLEGAVLKTRRNFNQAYYNASVPTGEIIFGNEFYNPASARLQNAAWRLAHTTAPETLAPALPADRNQPAVATDNRVPVDETGGRAPLSQTPSEYEDDEVWGAPIGRSD